MLQLTILDSTTEAALGERYSASMLQLTILDSTRSCMASTFEVISSMNRCFSLSTSFTRAATANARSRSAVLSKPQLSLALVMTPPSIRRYSKL
jgi:hypothetical protein